MGKFFMRMILAALLLCGTFTASALTIPANEDTYSQGGRITLSANNAGSLPVDINRKAFVYFSLEEVPSNAVVRFARLRLYTPSVRAKGNGIAIYRVIGEWNESAANVEPAIAQTPLGVVEAARLGSRRFVTLDVTSTVQDWISSPSSVNEGFAILPVTSGTANSTAVLTISAKDGPASGLPAQLEIELEPDSSSSQVPLIANIDDFNKVLKSSMSTEFLRSIKTSIFGFMSPAIASQPSIVISGNSPFLSVGATTDLGTLSYQWIKNGTLVVGGTSASLPLSSSYDGSYSVVVNNGTFPVSSQTVSLDAQTESYSWSTLAGVSSVGSRDGIGEVALFSSPRSVAVDPAGNTFVADYYSHTIRKVAPDGTVSTVAGLAGSSGFVDGVGADARFYGPIGIAADGTGNVFVADANNQRIRKISSDGNVSTFAGSGNAGATDGSGADASFYYPSSVAVDPFGNVYVAESSNHLIRKISASGQVTTMAGSVRVTGSSDGVGVAARFNSPYGIAVNGSGDVFVSDSYNHTIRRVTSSGVVTTLAGRALSTGSVDGVGTAARFNNPRGIAVDELGNVFVADFSNYAIRKIDGNGNVTTLAGSLGFSGYQSGNGGGARFTGLWGVAVTASGSVVVSENQRIRKVSPSGDVGEFAGVNPGSNDGSATMARFSQPSGVVADQNGNVFIADYFNHTIRKISYDGVVSTLSGSALASGTADGSGSNARFFKPRNLALDSLGNIYVADTGNHLIRKITQGGVVTTLAGSSGTVGKADGVGTAASFNSPYGVAADASGNVFVADTGNHAIRKISSDGGVTTLAGSCGFPGSSDGTRNSARFFSPNALVAASDGNLYVADTNTGKIRKVTSAGVVTTLAIGFSGSGIAIDVSGNLFVTDGGSNLIRKITPVGIVSKIGGLSGSVFDSFGESDGVSTGARFANPTAIAIGLNNKIYVVDKISNTVRFGVKLQ
jgi:sugar lactone lactonase YvrE